MPVREDIKDRVQQATDIVRLVGEQVALRARGKEFVGLCPFHDDKNPSLYVSPAKQIYKCFSCGAVGDVFGFVMNYHKMTFPEAIRMLAEQAGIEVEEERSRGGEGSSERQMIAGANAQALEFFRALLRHGEHGKVGREYIDRRGISPEMVRAFQLGLGPDRWDGLVQTVEQKRWDKRGFELAGLISARREGGGYYDRLRHRLIFPIFDAIGRPIAFGGRKLREEDEPKYLNSPETVLFNKSATLYGLHLAKKPIIDSRTAIIVEGYTDVIACHQAGVSNVVATLGTALTAEHVRELRRYAEKVVLIFDADEAGEKAADRAVELFLTGEVDVAIAVLPDGLDPADLMAREDALERWGAAIGAAEDALTYQFGRMRGQLEGAGTLTGRQRVAEAYLARVGQLGFSGAGAVRRSLLVQRLAQLLRMPETLVHDLLRKAHRPTGRVGAAGPGGAVEMRGAGEDANEVESAVAPGETRRRLKALALAERQVIGCLLKANELFSRSLGDIGAVDEKIPPQWFLTEASRRLYDRVYERLSSGGKLTLAGLLGDLAREDELALASIATQADMEVDGATGGDMELLETVITAAAQAIAVYHGERQYDSARAVLPASVGGEEQEQLVKRMLDYRRTNPSPVRIAKVK
jgi:DNA primase